MLDFIFAHYLTIKALHILSVIAWMAGLLYLPRLFVYHADQPLGSDTDALFTLMEQRLLKIIMLPAMIASFFFGGLLLFTLSWDQGWIHGKLLFVVLLAGLQGQMSLWAKDFKRGQNTKTSRFFRIINEVPFLCAIFIVFFVVLKPF